MDQEIHLKGLLIPVDWYGNGSVKAIALATDDEREISISGPLHRHILRYLRQQVEIWGVFEDPGHGRAFQVCRFQPVAPNPSGN